MTRSFLRSYLAYHMYKIVPVVKKLKKKTRLFRAVKCAYFVFKVSRGLATSKRVMRLKTVETLS